MQPPLLNSLLDENIEENSGGDEYIPLWFYSLHGGETVEACVINYDRDWIQVRTLDGDKILLAVSGLASINK